MSSPANMRRLGRLRVLQALAEAGEVSRGDLVQLTALSRATISSLIADLIREGVVREEIAASSRPGRPPLVVSLAPAAGYAFGLDLGHDHARLVLSDLAGTPVWDDTVEIDVDSSAEDTVAAATELIDAALEDTGIDRGTVLGLGVGIACPVDRRTGVLRAEGIMPAWVGTKPAEMFTERTGLRTLAVNDANACVVAERRYGVARGCDDVVYLRLSAGIGAGVVCDGRMLLGHDGLVGELGHISVDPRGEVCRCGNRGCLETIASPAAIAKLLSRSWGRLVTNAELMALVADGDRGATRAVEDAGDAVGRTLAMTVMTLNPRLVVVGGELAAAGDVLFDPIRRALRRNSVGDLHGELQVMDSALGDGASARGAAALVLAEAPNLLTIDKV
ncbi:ROK family transcriptional regulator [Lentzea sp. NPDC051213]|uniref:ROK family transcriptional regulator n=1 Tax=Lentzea sp. NPDC051213 TaxID=3364126 RepID=UPI0037B9F611